MADQTRAWRKVRDSNGRTWSHPSVTALMDEDGGNNDPEAIIRQAARELVDLAKGFGWAGPPYDMPMLASLAGLSVRGSRALPPDASAVLFGTAVFTNASHQEVRQRYSIGHEIIHTFFPDRHDSPVFTRHGAQDPDGEVEYLCQVGAAELVMPYWCFNPAAQEKPFGLRTAFQLAEVYGVSPEAALRRLVDRASVPAAAVMLTLRRRKSQETEYSEPLLPGFEELFAPAPEKLRIAYRPHLSKAMSARGVYLPVNKSIPESSVCNVALSQRRQGHAGIHCGHEVWEIPGLGESRVESVAWLPRNDSPAGAMALLWQP